MYLSAEPKAWTQAQKDQEIFAKFLLQFKIENIYVYLKYKHHWALEPLTLIRKQALQKQKSTITIASFERKVKNITAWIEVEYDTFHNKTNVYRWEILILWGFRYFYNRFSWRGIWTPPSLNRYKHIWRESMYVLTEGAPQEMHSLWPRASSKSSEWSFLMQSFLTFDVNSSTLFKSLFSKTWNFDWRWRRRSTSNFNNLIWANDLTGSMMPYF